MAEKFILAIWSIAGTLAWAMAQGNQAEKQEASPADTSVVLVDEGAAHAAILVASEAPTEVRQAAEQLRFYIHQITGVELPLVEVPAGETPSTEGLEVLIGVGPSPVTQPVFSTLPDDPYAPGGQDAVVRYTGGKLVLTGSKALQGQATRYAVGAFLRKLGVQCYRGFPRHSGGDRNDNPLYTIVPHRDRLAISPSLDLRVKVPFLARTPRSTLGSPWSSGGGVPWAMAHNWQNIFPEGTFETHPDYYALIEGQRTRGGILCETHPEVVAGFVKAAVAAFAQGAPAFSLTPADGTRTLCQCERCRRTYSDPGKTADRLVLFANAVRTELDRQHPEYRDRKLHILAGYGWPENMIPPSPDVVAQPGVVLWMAHQGCHAHRWDDPTCPINREWAAHLRGWMTAAGGSPIGIYEYCCYSNYNWDRKFSRFPVVSVRRVVQDIAAYHQAGVGYLYYEAEADWPRFTPYRWVNAYAIDRAMADPSLDPDQLLAQLCQDLYGPAAATLREYYELLQRRLEETPLHRGNWYLPDPAEVYSEEDLDHLTELMKEAVWQAQQVGGEVLERCLEAQKAWFEAVASLTDPDRNEPGSKEFTDPPW